MTLQVSQYEFHCDCTDKGFYEPVNILFTSSSSQSSSSLSILMLRCFWMRMSNCNSIIWRHQIHSFISSHHSFIPFSSLAFHSFSGLSGMWVCVCVCAHSSHPPQTLPHDICNPRFPILLYFLHFLNRGRWMFFPLTVYKPILLHMTHTLTHITDRLIHSHITYKSVVWHQSL